MGIAIIIALIPRDGRKRNGSLLANMIAKTIATPMPTNEKCSQPSAVNNTSTPVSGHRRVEPSLRFFGSSLLFLFPPSLLLGYYNAEAKAKRKKKLNSCS